MFECKNCNTGLDPDRRDDLWTEVGYDFERTGYDGVRDWCTETYTLKCLTCGHVGEYSSSWVTDPETDD